MSSSRLLLKARATRLLADSLGATMVEYAILLFLILVLAAGIYKEVGKKVRLSGDKTAVAFN